MTTKELLEVEVEKLSEEKLVELLDTARRLAGTKEQVSAVKPGLLSKLQRISLEGPEDFAANFCGGV